jgi:DNA modification methylase
MNEIKFKRDTAFRKQFFMPDSFAHPAKMDAQLLIWIVETYSKPGETILDPMAGSGTTMLACTLGRNVVLVELEEKFCKMCRDNWNEVKMHPQLGSSMGECQIIQGDARNLEGLLVDKIITSPPFAGQSGGLKSAKSFMFGDDNVGKRMMGGIKGGTGESPDNIDHLPYGNIDSIITSPPYEEAMGEKHHSPRADKLAKEKSNPVTYTDKIDAVITSPPYENAVHKEDEGHPDIGGGQRKENFQYSQSNDNIGNLKSDSYLSAMLQVYKQCFAVLKSGGLMILVTKDFIRNKKRVYLSLDTIRLCEQAGFKFIERHYRELPAQSFWRIIYKQKYPDAPEIKYEDVLVFNKVVPNP